MAAESIRTISKKKDTSKLDSIIQDERSRRSLWEQIWEESLFFYEGFQWLERDLLTKRLKRKDMKRRAPHQHYLIADRITSAVEMRLALLTQNDPVWQSQPSTDQKEDVRASALAQALGFVAWQDLDCAAKLQEVLIYSMVGQGYWEVCWNDKVGEEIVSYKLPDGTELPAGDDEVAQLKAQGVKLQRVVRYEGDPDIKVLSPWELFLFGSGDPTTAHSAIKVTGMEPEEIKERWGHEIEANSSEIASVPDTPMQHRGTKDPNLVEVKQLYVRPSAKDPKGRYLVWARDEVIYDGKFPYTDGQLPFVKFGGRKIPGSKYDGSWIYSLIPLQKAMNLTLSQIATLKDAAIAPPWKSPLGSGFTPPTGEANEVLEYSINRINKDVQPERIDPPPMAPAENTFSLFNTLFDEQSGSNELSRGEAPTNVEAGSALSYLHELAVTRLNPAAKDMERAVGRAFKLLLSRYQQFASMERIIDVRGAADISEVEEFEAADLMGAKDLRPVTGSMYPRSAAAEQEILSSLHANGAISTPEYLEATKSGAGSAISMLWKANKDRQKREIEAAKNGQIEVDEQGMPYIPAPASFDDHEAHLQVLGEYCLSVDFEKLDPLVQAVLVKHYDEHASAAAEAERQRMILEATTIKAAYQGRFEATPGEVAAVHQAGGIVGVDAASIAQERAATEAETKQSRQELELLKNTAKVQQQTADDMREMEKMRLQAEIDQDQAVLEAELDAENAAEQEDRADMREARKQFDNGDDV